VSALAPADALTWLVSGSDAAHAGTKTLGSAALNGVVKQYCQRCHNDETRRGNFSLSQFDVDSAPKSAEAAEKVIAKLRAGMMPPPGQRRPSPDTLAALVATLERQLDAYSAAHPNPGRRTFQRLNRAEYTVAVRELLGLEIDGASYLPPDTKSDNFDNIADVQALSPTLLDAYLRAASEVSWLALGNAEAARSSATYSVPRTASQVEHVEGAPYGTRGGISVLHTFPADGDYAFFVNFFHETTGAFAGGLARDENLEISIDGARVALLAIDRFMHASDPSGVALSTDPVRVTAGPHRVAAAFVPPRFQGVVQDLISPLKWSLNSTSNATAYGFSLLPHLRDLVINGPLTAVGVSETPARQRIFSCRPGPSRPARSCAESIVRRLATEAYRRPLSGREVGALMTLYDQGASGSGGQHGGFEAGVRGALEAILASPDFVFRLERVPAAAKPGDNVKVGDLELASRLSFFLWSAPPDAQLRRVAAQGTLNDPAVLEREARRMLKDPRATALATRFAAQWLRLPDLDVVQPDVRQYPDFDEQLRVAMRRETEEFFDHLVREDRSVLDLYRADYTYVNARLAQHYGMQNVVGTEFRRVSQTDSMRRGILGHASVLTLTSHATRTSAVERGKWVMEVLLNSPPPPPPPGVPDLESTPGVHEGKVLTVRERMEEHRRNPACTSCHKMMDPIGLAMEHYDATGRWRERDNGMPIDSRGELWDGTKVQSLPELQAALLNKRESLLRTFTQNLMAYAIGRRVEATDLPTVRQIVRVSATRDHKMSSYVLGVIKSPAFRMQRVEGAGDRKAIS
jgi:hypothetical protein